MSDVSAAAKKKMKKKERSLKKVGRKARRCSRSCDLRPHMEHVRSRQVPFDTFDPLGWQQVLHCIMVKAAGSPALSSCSPPVHLEEPSESD